MTAGAGVRCAVHTGSFRHAPPIVCSPQFHHLRPREWQRSLVLIDADTSEPRWAPGVTPPPGKTIALDKAYGIVWDTQGVLAGPTCHGNVHIGIEALTHAWEPHVGDTVTACLTRARKSTRLDLATWSVARMALDGWVADGQTVEWLIDRHLWGQI